VQFGLGAVLLDGLLDQIVVVPDDRVRRVDPRSLSASMGIVSAGTGA
jgi:hypothetical protein